MTTSREWHAGRVKVACLGVVLAGAAITAAAGGADMFVLLAVLGVGLFIGLGLVPMSFISARVGLPTTLVAVFGLQAAAIALFPLLQPVSTGYVPVTRAALSKLPGLSAVGSDPLQVGAASMLVVALASCIVSFVLLRRQQQRPDWVRPPSATNGFWGEGPR